MLVRIGVAGAIGVLLVQTIASTPTRLTSYTGDLREYTDRGIAFAAPSRWAVPALAPGALADDGTIVNLADMKPQTTDSHCSVKPVRYVLEMHQGWFAKRGVQAGTRLSGPPFESRR